MFYMPSSDTTAVRQTFAFHIRLMRCVSVAYTAEESLSVHDVMSLLLEGASARVVEAPRVPQTLTARATLVAFTQWNASIMWHFSLPVNPGLLMP